MYVAPLQPSTQFYSRFSLPRSRSNRFGSHPSDSRHFHTSPLIACGLVAFATPPPHQVRLATKMHSLARYSKRTVHAHFHARTTLYVLGFRVFSHPVIGSFQLSLAVLFAIGLSVCLALAVSACHLHSSYPRTVTLALPITLLVPATGLSPCSVLRSRRLRRPKCRVDTTPTSPPYF